MLCFFFFFFFSSRRRHTRFSRDWSSDVCSSDLWRLRLKDEKLLERELGDHSEPYRRLGAAALESVFLTGAVGLSAEDIAAKRGLGYTPDAGEAIAKLRAGEYDAAFFLGRTPVELVREIAAAGETMPPKSTYFFPKLLTGIVFNPLS